LPIAVILVASRSFTWVDLCCYSIAFCRASNASCSTDIQFFEIESEILQLISITTRCLDFETKSNSTRSYQTWICKISWHRKVKKRNSWLYLCVAIISVIKFYKIKSDCGVW
jgi:hypothetical protein